MTSYIDKSGLHVAADLVRFIETRALPGTGIAAEAFWAGAVAVFARLAPGTTLAQANAEAKRLAAQSAADFPQIDGRWGASVRGLRTKR